MKSPDIPAPPLPPSTEFIVAEVSKNWTDGTPHGGPALISQQFEQVIEVNRQRGYVLHSWQTHRMLTGPRTMNETIIAVFRRVEQAGEE